MNSISALEQSISSDIEERQRLMLQMKTLAPRYSFNDRDEKLFLSYSIPIVYSLWEGFVQSSFRVYIQEINKLNLEINTVCKPLLVYHLETQFKQFKEYPEKETRKISFFNSLHEFYNLELIEINHVINTQSNVGFSVLNSILKTFNLDPIPQYLQSQYSLKIELDGFLLKIRNAVAHGQDSYSVSRDDLERAITLVEQLMDLVFERIKNGLHSRSYLHNP